MADLSRQQMPSRPQSRQEAGPSSLASQQLPEAASNMNSNSEPAKQQQPAPKQTRTRIVKPNQQLKAEEGYEFKISVNSGLVSTKSTGLKLELAGLIIFIVAICSWTSANTRSQTLGSRQDNLHIYTEL